MEEQYDGDLWDDADEGSAERLAEEVAGWEVGAGWRASEDRSQDVVGEPGTDEQIRQALVGLLSLMRPDWGSDEGITSRVLFAQQRLNLSLPRICADAVRFATQPGAAPDAFIAIDARRPSTAPAADPVQLAELLRETRRQLAGRRVASGVMQQANEKFR